MLNVKNTFGIILSVLLLSGCGKDTEIVTVKESVPSTSVNEVTQIVSEKNNLNTAKGLAPIVPGLVCTLYNLQNVAPSPTVMPTSLSSPVITVGSYILLGEFNQPNSSTNDGLNVLPNTLRSLYKTNYMLRCSGYLVVTKNEYVSLSVTSDDASMLYINNSLMVDNNGLHGSQKRTGVRFMERGVHSFRLDYLQANGNQHLVVEDSSGVVTSDRFWR